MKLRGVLFLLASFSLPSVYAQAVLGFGTITGTIKDYTGSGIPDTTVIISNPDLHIEREFDTTIDGLFNATALPPHAGYSVKISRNGFKTQEYKNFELLTGHTLNFVVAMLSQPPTGRPEEKESLRLYDVTDDVEITFSPLEVSALPAADRDPDTLIPLGSYVVPDYQTGQMAFHSQSGTNAVQTDGILTTNTYFFDKAPLTPPATEEQLEGVQVVSAGAPAEFGHTIGGTLNLVSRSGSEGRVHGEVYDYFNNHALNATDRFAPGFRPPDWQHQFGADAGGSAPHSFFWFLNAEDLDRHTAGLNLGYNGLLTNGAGSAIDPSNCGATAAQCTAAIKFLNSQLGQLVHSTIESVRGLGKLDWRPTHTSNVNAEFGAIHQHSPFGTDRDTVSDNAGLLGYNGTYTDETRFAKAGYTAILAGDAVNEARYILYRDRLSDYEPIVPSGLIPAPDGGVAGINIAGDQFGGNPQLPFALSEKRWQIIDNLTVGAGSSSIKLGFYLDRDEDWNRQVINSAGDYYFPTLTTFADDFSGNTGNKRDYTLFNLGFGRPIVDLHSLNVGVYAQDSWNLLKRLTLVIGVVWEKPFLPQPVNTSPVFYQTATITSPNIDVSPRVGISYRIDDRTVVRLGISSFYQPFSGQLLESLFTGNAIYQLQSTITPNQTGSPIFPRVIGTPGGIPAGSTDVLFEPSKFRIPLSAQGTVTVERSLGRDMTVSLNYLYARGISLWTGYDTNLNAPTVTKTYTIDNAAGNAVGTYPALIYNSKTNNTFAQVVQLGTDGTSRYDGASIRFQKRMSHGITFDAAYTWSRAIDDVSGPPAFAGFIPASYMVGDYRDVRGPSAFNQPNRGTAVWTWRPVFSVGDSVFTRYFVNGWQLSGAATFATGLKETPQVVVNAQQFTGVTMAYPTSLNGSGGWSLAPFEGINNLSLGPQYDVDARLSRDIPITERIRATLMFEAFNAFNTQFNTSVNTLSYLATSGILHPVPGAGLGNSAAGYPWGDNARHMQVALRVVF